MKKYDDDCFEVIITISNETPTHMIINELSDWFVAVLGGFSNVDLCFYATAVWLIALRCSYVIHVLI